MFSSISLSSLFSFYIFLPFSIKIKSITCATSLLTFSPLPLISFHSHSPYNVVHFFFIMTYIIALNLCTKPNGGDFNSDEVLNLHVSFLNSLEPTFTLSQKLRMSGQWHSPFPIQRGTEERKKTTKMKRESV